MSGTIILDSESLISALARYEFKVIVEGRIIADGTEQIILDANGGTVVLGYVDLSEMQTGDVVVIKTYVKVRSDADYKIYASQEYIDAQSEPIVYILPKYTANGLRITLQQTKGVYRSFSYIFIKVI
jgi:hypothetical protein